MGTSHEAASTSAEVGRGERFSLMKNIIVISVAFMIQV